MSKHAKHSSSSKKDVESPKGTHLESSQLQSRSESAQLNPQTSLHSESALAVNASSISQEDVQASQVLPSDNVVTQHTTVEGTQQPIPQQTTSTHVACAPEHMVDASYLGGFNAIL